MVPSMDSCIAQEGESRHPPSPLMRALSLCSDGGASSQTSAEEDSKQKICSGEPPEEEGVRGRPGEQV